METVNIKINGVDYAVAKGSTVLEAAKAANIDIPTLCYLKDINEIGACRLCLVEVSEGGRPYRLVTACVYPVTEGMSVLTNTPRIMKSRKTNLELVLSTHDRKCLSCIRSTTCELQKLCLEYGVDENRFKGTRVEYKIIEDKCKGCTACARKCPVNAISGSVKNPHTIDTSKCIKCGACISTCKFNAIIKE